MIGLPGETVRDLDAIGDLCLQIQQTIRETNRDNKTIPRLNVGISCFVPKAMSPFERAPMECEKNLKKRLKHVVSILKTIREIRYSHDTPRWAIVQGMIARGDRRIAEWIALSGKPGVDWYKTFMDLPDSVTRRIHVRIPLSERLPWDHREDSSISVMRWRIVIRMIRFTDRSKVLSSQETPDELVWIKRLIGNFRMSLIFHNF